MTQLHSALALPVLLAVAAFALASVLAAWLDRGHAPLQYARWVLGAGLALEVLFGVIAYLGGSRPAEALHLIYGIAVVAVLPLASTFAADAPPRARSGVMALAGLVMLLLIWRLLSTG
jgi:4-amino-4-deoxy-L-arabinose transferase-like glycosyltransferase